jgi:hypothetical protein
VREKKAANDEIAQHEATQKQILEKLGEQQQLLATKKSENEAARARLKPLL